MIMAAQTQNVSTIPAHLWGDVFEALTASDVSIPSVIQGRQELMKQAALEGEWPERLLHVPSMTSIKRSHFNHYGSVTQPRFTVLSYKWGLWIVKDGSRLEVKGISWETPAIDRKRWTVVQFQQLIKRMAQDTDFVWIDVACINQFLTDSTLREIQKEPQMFRKANQAFVWIVDFDPDVLEQMLNETHEAAESLLDASEIPKDETDLELIPSVLARVLATLDTLLCSPWFRSNYTLREIVLCNKVIILNREAKIVPIHNNEGKPAVIDEIAIACATMLAWLQRVQRRKIIPDSITSLVVRCLELVRTNGPFFLYSSLPGTLYHYTQKLLTTGLLLIQGKAGEQVHEECWDLIGHGWGSCYRIECTCTEICECPPAVSRNFLADTPFEITWPLGYGKDGPGPPPRKKTCIPCILNISYKVGDTVIDSHTPFKELV